MQDFSMLANNLFEDNPGSWKITLNDGRGIYFNTLNKHNPQRTGLNKLWYNLNNGDNLVGFWNVNKWENQLKDWLEAGHKIDVILANPVPEGVENWKYFMRKYPESVSIYSLYSDHAKDNKVRSYIKSLETYRPIILEGPSDKNAMWLVGHQDPDSVISYNINWYPPSSCSGDDKKLFKDTVNNFDRLLGRKNNPSFDHVEIIQAELPLFQTVKETNTLKLF